MALVRHISLSVAIVLALVGCKSGAKPLVAVETQGEIEQRQRDEVAGYLMRLGMGRWMVACAYERGRRGDPRETVFRKCMIDTDPPTPLRKAK